MQNKTLLMEWYKQVVTFLLLKMWDHLFYHEAEHCNSQTKNWSPRTIYILLLLELQLWSVNLFTNTFKFSPIINCCKLIYKPKKQKISRQIFCQISLVHESICFQISVETKQWFVKNDAGLKPTGIPIVCLNILLLSLM